MRLALMGFLIALVPALLTAAPTSKKIKQLRTEGKSLETEIEELDLYIHSLDENQSRLSDELLAFEGNLRSRLRNVAVPLLSWPDRIFTKESSSWVEFQHSQLVLKNLREKLVKEPLRLMADRELKISELQRMRQELEENVSSLKTKRELLNLQLEELELINSRENVRLPSASASKKRKIGDIEAPLE